MKNNKLKIKYYLLLCFILFMITSLFSSNTGSSTAFSNSYLQRAYGPEANYWNPANIYRSFSPTRPSAWNAMNNEILILPYALKLENNSLSLDLYNSFAGQTIEDFHKQKILNSIDNSIHGNMNLNLILFGYSHKNFAFSTALNTIGRFNLDEEFVEIILFGNKYTTSEQAAAGERHDHQFDHKHNNFDLLTYQDFTISYGGYRLNDIYPSFLDDYPNIYAGIGLSYLTGLANIESLEFDGSISAHDDEGMSLSGDVITREGFLGNGVKMSFGLSSDEIEIARNQYVSVGLTFDNIFGSIKWDNGIFDSILSTFDVDLDAKRTNYTVSVDSVYGNDLEGDLIVEEQHVEHIPAYTTKLPLVFRLGAKYTYYDLSATFDYAHNHGYERAYINDPEISFGLEHPIYYKWLPAQVGYRVPIGDHQALYSFGLGLRFRNFETGFGYQSIGAFFSNKTQGLSLGGYMKVRY